MADYNTQMRSEAVQCRVCESSQPVLVTENLRGSRFKLMRCRRCGVEFLGPQPSFEEIKGIYSSDYYTSWGMEAGENQLISDTKKRTFARRISEIREHVGGGKLLDVGTASGFFLEVAQENGFDPYGVELSEYAGGLAAQKFGKDRIHIGTLETAPFSDGMFSVIAMTDLIEHVTDPVFTLRSASRLLAPGGVLLITTPDTASFSRRMMGTRWTHYKLEHLFYWDASSFGMLAEMVGLQVISCKAATKTVSLRYVRQQLSVYHHWLLTPLSRLAEASLGPLASKSLSFTMGDMAVLLRK